MYICTRNTGIGAHLFGAISSAGSEHLVYTEGVGGSNPSSPTKIKFYRNVGFFIFIIFRLKFSWFSILILTGVSEGTNLFMFSLGQAIATNKKSTSIEVLFLFYISSKIFSSAIPLEPLIKIKLSFGWFSLKNVAKFSKFSKKLTCKF